MTDRSNSHALSWMNGHSALVGALFSTSYFAATLLHAETKPFWNDEIYTVIHARLPSIAEMWRTSRQGFDLMPPLNAMLAHAVTSLFGEGRVTMRLPAIVGYWLACVVVFGVVRRRAGATMALVGAELFALTATYRFAYETRGYGLLLGCSAVALFAWSEAAAGRRRTAMVMLMAAALAASVWAHYFGVLTFAVIGLGELWRDVERRRLDLAIWVGIVAGGLGVLPLLRLVGLGHQHTTSYWGAAQHFGLGSVYTFIFLPLPDWGLVAAPAVLAFVLLAVVSVLEGRNRGRESGWPPLPAHEIVAWAALAMLPVIGLAVVRIVGSGLVPRYFLVVALATAGIPIGLSRSRARAGWQLLLCAVVSFAWLAQAAQVFMPGDNKFKDPTRDDPALMSALSGAEPVVVANPIQYLQLWFYTPADLRGRLVYLADEQASIRRLGSTTADASLIALRRWCDVNVAPFEDFITPGKRFQVYAADNGWLIDELRARHVRLDPGPADAHRRFYWATVPSS